MIISYGYDVEVLPNFFSITFVDISDYLNAFKDAYKIGPKNKKVPIPLVQKYTVAEIKEKLNNIKKYEFYITDKDDSQYLSLLGFINNMRPHYNEQNVPIRVDAFGYNTSRYDKLMVAALLMYSGQTNTTKELITRLYDTSKKIIDLQNDPEIARNDYFLNSLKKYKIPYNDVDTMTIFALNKSGKGLNKDTGKTVYFPKGLKQTSINLQWYELLDYDLPSISEKDFHFYSKNYLYKDIPADKLNLLIDKWDRYILPEWIPPMMHYNGNDVFIVCEMIRLYIDEIRLRYNISKVYEVNVLSSSRSDIADKLFTKFYSEFSNIHPKVWGGQRTERTAMAFKRVILPIVQFQTPVMQDLLARMKKVIIYSIGKDSFQDVVRLGKLDYTIATGGLHSQDTPRELRSKCIPIESNNDDSSTGKIQRTIPVDSEWSNLTDDSYVYVHWDITSFYPALISLFKIAPAHLNEGVFVKLVTWLMNTRIDAKHSKEDMIDGIPKEVLAEVLKIVINSIYGKLGYEYGDLLDKLAVLKVTINGQLLIMMLCEDLEVNGIEVASANTDGIVVKLYKKDKAKFNEIADRWKETTGLKADSEDYEVYVNRDINNYFVREFNGKMTYKGALNPLMYAADLSKGYDMPIVAQAVVNFFLEDKPVLNTLYECKNILDFCKTQNVGKQYHIELSKNGKTVKLQRNVRYYVSTRGSVIEKVSNASNTRANLCARQKVVVLNSLDDVKIEYRNINYTYYYDEAYKIINPIKLGISPKQKGDRRKGTKSGKSLIKTYAGQFNTLFDDNND